jgi:hypothetical protein
LARFVAPKGLYDSAQGFNPGLKPRAEASRPLRGEEAFQISLNFAPFKPCAESYSPFVGARIARTTFNNREGGNFHGPLDRNLGDAAQVEDRQKSKNFEISRFVFTISTIVSIITINTSPTSAATVFEM